MKKSFSQLLAEAEQEKEELKGKPSEEPKEEPDMDLDDDEDEKPPVDPEKEIDDQIKDQPSGETDYSPDDLREIIDYVFDILDKSDDGMLNDSVGEVGLDLIYNYADVMPQSLLNELVDDMKSIFEIDDTLIEAIVNEDSAFIKKKGPAAIAAAKAAKKHYGKNKKAKKKECSDWRESERGQEIIALHNKIHKKLKKKKGIRLKNPVPSEPEM